MLHRLAAYIQHRSQHVGPHHRAHVNKQRRTALILVFTGLARVAAWLTMMSLYVLHLLLPHVAGFTEALFQSVPFVAMISLYANAATDFGQVCASLAQLTAGDAHADTNATRQAVTSDFAVIQDEIRRLALLHPGPDADKLAADIAQRLPG